GGVPAPAQIPSPIARPLIYTPPIHTHPIYICIHSSSIGNRIIEKWACNCLLFICFLIKKCLPLSTDTLLPFLYETKFTFTFKLEITGDFANATFAIRLTSSSEAEVFA